MTFTLTPSRSTLTVSAGAVESSERPDRRVPLTIPTAQEYYWHFAWQAGERQALSDIDAGDVVRFDGDDPDDISRWLNEPDDE
jgi:hypothetical protein